MSGKKRFQKPGSLQPNIDDILEWSKLPEDAFDAASSQEKADFIKDRKSVSYWADAWRRLRKNKVAMVALAIIIALVIFGFVGPSLVPYTYKQQVRGSEAVEKARAEAAAEGKELSRIEESKIRAKANVSQSKESEEHVTEAEAAKALGIKHKVFGYSTQELQKKADGEKVFPHVFGTDDQGRDIMVRVMVGTRISIIVGVCAAIIVLIIGALYGSVSGYCGGAVDTVMQRIVEIIYSIPEMLIILLLSATLKPALEQFQNSGDGPMQNLVTILGPNLISMFIAFGLLYWVTMSRIIRGQILQLKQQEYVTAARALGAKGGRIISKHLLPNCIGQIITTTFLQIPSAIFLESFLSFIGVGVSAPLTSLGSMCSEALSGLSTYPYRLFIPAFILSLMILALNLFGDGLRDALDPKLKK